MQQKRLELYKDIPYRGNRKHLAILAKWSEPTWQEDEIKLIEKELNRRLSKGDKNAYFEPAAPNIYKHTNPAG